ncbi:MAG: zinc ABC transporter substrate-binding protein [Hyphomicrobiales bacterium]|nr:zinc ABC transporter substrate-binding protein [Hyphomicrobiales bacterium]MDE1973465.1 zinc ABC transporter substrate-binding protein [Hyphomicrobiales bacterium]MDE2286009.1 zinc ABC transporter substrate-binding protein [Hyphomicrobiales bacterium]
MKVLLALAAACLGVFTALPASHAANGKIAVVAAENFYGDVARQVGGEQVAVTSIMSSPDQDPHLFEVSPTVIRQIAGAQIVVYNGADYDPWMAKLIAATPKSGRRAIVAAELLHRQPGDNPHLWYDPATMPAVAAAVAAALTAVDPAHANDYAARLKTFLASLAPLNDRIARMRGKYAGVPVTATEPVFGYMADALKLKMRNERLQLAIMNDTEPSIRDVAAFERDLKQRRVRVLFYNKQASNTLVRHLVEIARASSVAVVGVTETCPPGVTYQEWMKNELDATERALPGPSS